MDRVVGLQGATPESIVANIVWADERDATRVDNSTSSNKLTA